MDIRRSLNLLRGDFGTRRIGTIGCFKGIYTTRTKPLRAYLQDAIYMGLSYGSISEIRLIMVHVKVVKRGMVLLTEMTIKIKLDCLFHLFETLGICQKVRSISGLQIMEGGLIQSIYLWHPTDGFLTHLRFPHTSTSLL
ncbi:hypothetical protein Bca4012_099942 [Brassica carinata]